ncbi:hypothetical protein BDW74DRAFT_8454 [Aspergillus multicolor]|uniref:uncharacterized protein n=1 Tax=Aspergillus multicolor TaxID=41759 RepID=UPI003CCD6363
MEASSAAVGTFGRPPSSEDRLFEADYEHVGGSDCTRCDPAKLVHREPKAPDVHFGVIAIGPRLRDGTVRDELNKTMQAISFDSELWIEQVEYPCINVRGIADYADSHPTDKQWNQHAAARAMAFVYMVLKRLSLEAVEQIPTARSVLEHEEEEERKRIDELRFGKQRSQGLSGRAGYN